MATFIVSAADLRDPMDSAEIFFEVEGPITRDENGACCCYPVSNPSPDGGTCTELSWVHLHGKYWGRNPDASPRYFEIPIR